MPMRAPKCRGSAAIVIIVSDAARNNRSYTTASAPPGDVGDLGWQGEDDVEIADWQQVTEAA